MKKIVSARFSVLSNVEWLVKRKERTEW